MMKKIIWALAFLLACGFAMSINSTSYCDVFNETDLFACWRFDSFEIVATDQYAPTNYPQDRDTKEWLQTRAQDSRCTIQTSTCVINNCTKMDSTGNELSSCMYANIGFNSSGSRMDFPRTVTYWWKSMDLVDSGFSDYSIDFSEPSGVGSGNIGNLRIFQGVGSNNTIRFDCGSNYTNINFTALGKNITDWHYISIVQNTTQCDFYLDGSLLLGNVPNDLSRGTGDITAGISIGARGFGEWDFSSNQWLDEFMVFNRTLSSGEITALYNYATANATVQCNDGADNDGDGKIDLNDPSCDDINDNNESPQDYFECEDSVDNDGDSFTDYPSDPSCASALDDSEAPFDTPQCSDGLDNDLDGLTDYPTDPSCSSTTDNSELPKDASLQAEDDCLVEEQCILFDSIPYTDDPELHGWSAFPLNMSNINYLGGNHILVNTIDEDGFKFNQVIEHNNTNINNYNEVHAQLKLFLIANTSASVDDEQVAIQFSDGDDNPIITLIFNITTSGASPYVAKVNVYATNSDTLAFVGTTYVDSIGYMQVDIDFDELANMWDLTVEGVSGTASFSGYSYHSGVTGQVDEFFMSNTISTYDMQVILSEINVFGTDYEVVDSVCDTWELPFYLKESFLGFQSECDWVVSNEIFFFGQLAIPQALDFYFQQKDLSEIARDENVRYVTVTYDLNVINVTTGSTITFRLYDEEGFNFWTIFYRDSGDDLWYNDDGTGIVAQASIPNNETFAYKFVIDMQQDKFDIYFNDSLVVSDAGLTEAFYNLETVETIKISANDAEFTMDNLYIFGSDSGGTELLPDDEVVEEVDDELSMCGLFHNNQINCVNDEDCDTGDCLPSNKCSRFDFSYCDENAIKRGSFCMLSGITGCVTSSTGGFILDYFFQFLVIIIILMGVVYLSVLTMRSRRSG